MIRDWDSYILRPRERRIVGALASALYDPLGPGLTADALEALRHELVDDVQVWLGTPHFALRTALRALLAWIEVSPVRYGFGPRTMSHLPLEARVRYLTALDDAGEASLETWKSILGMAYFARPVGAAKLNLARRAA